jgi:hypothetical protein
MITKATKALQSTSKLNDEEPDWVRWTGKSRFTRQCREGDTLIKIWRSNKAKRPSTVYRPTPVLLKQKTKTWTRFYLRDGNGMHATLTWGQFKKLLQKVSYPRAVGPSIEHLVDPDIAEAIAKKWNSASKW